LTTIADVRRLVTFFVKQQNSVPHSSFKGQAPDEMYAGTGHDVVAELEEARGNARQERMARNRAHEPTPCLVSLLRRF
jgi:hypothetical protein